MALALAKTKCPEEGASLKSSLLIAFLSVVTGALTENLPFPRSAAPPNKAHVQITGLTKEMAKSKKRSHGECFMLCCHETIELVA